MVLGADKLERLVNRFRRCVPASEAAAANQTGQLEGAFVHPFSCFARLSPSPSPSPVAKEVERNSLVSHDRPHCTLTSTTHDALCHLLYGGGHRRAKHCFPQLFPLALAALAGGGRGRDRARSDDFVGLFEKVELEELVGFVEDQVVYAASDARGQCGERAERGEMRREDSG